MIYSFFIESNSDFVLSAYSAGAQHGLCADSLHHVMFANVFKPDETHHSGNISYTEILYMDWDDLHTIEGTTLRYTGLNQTVMDMIHIGTDMSRVDEAIEVLHEEDKLDDFITYAREHGLPEEELKFALEGLLDSYPDVFYTYYSDEDGIVPRMGGYGKTIDFADLHKQGIIPSITGLTTEEAGLYLNSQPGTPLYESLTKKIHYTWGEQ